MKRALITGANRGLGLELTRRLTARGVETLAACRASSDELDATGARVVTGMRRLLKQATRRGIASPRAHDVRGRLALARKQWAAAARCFEDAASAWLAQPFPVRHDLRHDSFGALQWRSVFKQGQALFDFLDGSHDQLHDARRAPQPPW